MKGELDDLDSLTRAVFLNTGYAIKSPVRIEFDDLPEGLIGEYREGAKRIQTALGHEKRRLDVRDIERLAEASWWTGKENHTSPEGKVSVWDDVHPESQAMHRRMAGAVALALGFTVPSELLKEIRSDDRKEQTCSVCNSWRICEFCSICADWHCDDCRPGLSTHESSER